MDGGPIIAQEACAISPADDYHALLERLTALGVAMLQRALDDMAAGRARARPQTGPASRAPLLTREDGRSRWEQDSGRIAAQVRACAGWPQAYCTLPDRRVLKVLRAEELPAAADEAGLPGEICDASEGQGVVVACGSGRLALCTVQPAGRQRMSAWAFWNGARLSRGALLS